MTRPDAAAATASRPASTLEGPRPRQRGRRLGFTLIELLIGMVIVGVLAAIALPNYSRLRERAYVARAIGDIKAMSQNIGDYQIETGSLPAALTDVGSSIVDPWGHPYQYLPITGPGTGFRKDRFLVPINTDYDLYSMGPDGASVGPTTTAPGQDDIVRANDGGFVGLASEF